MNKDKTIIHYTAAMALFRKLLSEGVISEEELQKIEILLTSKYGLSAQSIYR